MEFIKKINSESEFIKSLLQMIKHLDQKTFKKPAKVLVGNYKGSGIAGFYSKRWLFRKLGLADVYVIFAKNQNQINAINGGLGLERLVVCVAIHEVRHRFQFYHPQCLISADFIRGDKTFIDKIYKPIYERYGYNEKVFERELDAALIESIVFSYYQFPKFTVNIVEELITCNEHNVLEIISKIKSP